MGATREVARHARHPETVCYLGVPMLLDPEPWSAADYGDGCADYYDEIYPQLDAATLQGLLALARGGPALDLGAGTGRALLALAARGVAVAGVEASPAMVERLRAKAGGDTIPLVLGDFTHCDLGGPYRLIFSLVNSFFLLPDPALQSRALANAASALAPDGVLALELYGPFAGEEQRTVESTHRLDTSLGARLYRVRMRCSSPAELDAMAADAGLVLRERTADWCGTRFASPAGRWVSVYVRAEPG